jgi:DNA (cytosine-5)-methyltransferase 1
MTQPKWTVFDLFAGAGGFGLGFEMANFDLRVSLEKDAWAIDTLIANKSNPSHLIIEEDIRELCSLEAIVDLTAGVQPDVIIGGPPCQGFSLAGPPKDPADPRNTLFINFAKWVEFLRPEVFVMENVPGILGRKNEQGDRVIDIIQASFRDLGYYVEVWRLNAVNYGVPQSRERVFIVGNLHGKEIGKPAATHASGSSITLGALSLLPPVTVGEAIGDLPNIAAGEGSEIMEYSKPAISDYQLWARQGSSNVNNHVSMLHTKRMVERYSLLQSGKTLDEIPELLKVRKRNGNGALSTSSYQSNYRHLKADQVSFTIPASFYSTFIHPFRPRNLTSREAARLQSFPDHYVFKGKRTLISTKLQEKKGEVHQGNLSQYNQIGNAVPPLLAFHIAMRIGKFLNEQTKKSRELFIPYLDTVLQETVIGV